MSWLSFLDSLAAQFEVLAPEHPGFGSSDNPAWLHHVPDLAMFYLDLLEEMNLQDIHLIGHSLGGWIAAEIAIRDTSRLRSMTLIAPAGLRVKGVPMGDLFIWSPEERVRNLYCDQAWAERVLERQLSEHEVEAVLKNRFAAAKYMWQPRGFNPDLDKWLHRAKLPTHIIWGDADRLLPVAFAEAWRERLPQARVTVIAQCGHLPHVEKADDVASAVSAFAKRSSAPAR